MADDFGFPDFIEDFLSGDLPYSPYTSHVASYVRAADSEGADKKFLIIRYEDLKTNLRDQVYLINEFLGLGYLQDEYWDWIRWDVSVEVNAQLVTYVSFRVQADSLKCVFLRASLLS